MIYDAIVVGSGPSGANAAAALVEGARSVLMLDVGNADTRYQSLIPAKPFREVRETDPDQHRYFLGDDFEGVTMGAVRTGAQLTPPRAHAIAETMLSAPIISSTFDAAESQALGGLGAAWGAGVFGFDDDDLATWPIARDDLLPHYDAVARRIGIAAADDDVTPFFGRPGGALPPLEIDSNAESVLGAYRARRDELREEGFHLGQTPLAACSVRHRDRGPHPYHDMDFWSDEARSVYRPQWTLDELRASPLFTYESGSLVTHFREEGDLVSVLARRGERGESQSFNGRALVLAAGTLGTARIVLRSLGRAGQRVPLLCNPYTYVPVVNLGMLGREVRERRHSLAQLTAVYRDPDVRRAHDVQVQFYSYRSLLTFRLLKEAPLGYRDGMQIMQRLMPMLGILGINHDDSPTASKYCALEGTGDTEVLRVHYELSEEESQRIDRAERSVLRCFRRLSCWPIKRVRPGHGSSIHYGGTFPMRRKGGSLTCDESGRLFGTRAVHLVDGSVLPYLPAKGLTFTIMANANRIGAYVAASLPR